jgi:MFS family permease
MSIGPISLSILMGLLAFKWQQVYLFWLIPIILGAIAVLRIGADPIEEEPIEIQEELELDEPIKTTSILTLSLVLFLVFVGVRTVGRSMIGAFLPIYMVQKLGMTESFSQLVFGSNTLMGLVAAPLGGALASRFGEKRWLLGVLGLSYISLAVAFTSPGTTAFVAFYLLSGFFNFLGMAANSSIVAKLSPSKQRGLGYALFFLPGSVMGAVAPVIAAYIGDIFGLVSIFTASIVVYIVGLGVLQFGVKTETS